MKVKAVVRIVSLPAHPTFISPIDHQGMMPFWIPYSFTHYSSSFAVLIAPEHALRSGLERAVSQQKEPPLYLCRNAPDVLPALGPFYFLVRHQEIRTLSEICGILEETAARMILIEYFPGMLEEEEESCRRFVEACRMQAHERGAAVRVIALTPDEALLRLSEEADRMFLSIQPALPAKKQRENMAVRDDRQNTLENM
ncbi:MAG: hypothetical protein APR53_05000 [Methanoculleus sp. SDB]|nr:MAG: hypothetical protein APR53_05000 [Methanoculleus sp. SDB]